MIKKIKDLGRLHHKLIVSTLFAASTNFAPVRLSTITHTEVWDLAVIGGGSGGLATAF